MGRSEIARAAAVLFVLLNVIFAPFLWGDRSLLSSARDASSILLTGGVGNAPIGVPAVKAFDSEAPAWVLEPALALEHHQYFAEHTIPLWNPYVAFGTPLAADMQSQPFSPFAFLPIVKPSPATYNWFVVLRLFVAGILTFLYLRLFVGFVPSLFGEIVFALNGYFLIYYDMPHLSVEVLTGGLFYAIELLLRAGAGTWRTVVLVMAVALILLGGMPESAALLLTFGALYFVFRVASDPALRARWLGLTSAFAIANVAGIGCAAFLLAPFVEFVTVSYNIHESTKAGGLPIGLTADSASLVVQGLATHLMPLAFGSPWNTLLGSAFGPISGLRGSFGVVAFYFALYAIAIAAAARTRRDRTLDGLVAFFGTLGVVLLLKRFGFPLVNEIGALPVFRLILFVKYVEPLIAFCVAVIAAIGVAHALQRAQSAAYALLTGIAGLATVTWIVAATHSRLSPQLPHANMYYISVLAAIGTLVVLTCVTYFIAMRQTASPRWRATASSASIIVVLAFELGLNYVGPMFYVFNPEPDKGTNPYAGSPYIEYLRHTTAASRSRIFGEDSVLYPNWAEAFGLFDVRGIDALYSQRYLTFVQNFLSEPQTGSDNDLNERVTGQGGYLLTAERERRLLALSSTEYVLKSSALKTPGSIITELWRQHRTTFDPGTLISVKTDDYTVAGVTKQGLFEHPPFERLPVELDLPKGAQTLRFSMTLLPVVWDACGEGADFILDVQIGNRTERIFERYIDPKHIRSQRRWNDAVVDIHRFAGQHVTLLLTTAPGPRGDTCADWAAWGDLRIAGPGIPPLPPSPFTLEYNHEIKIYKLRQTNPRAILYFNAKAVDSDDQALRVLRDASFDVFEAATVTSPAADPGTADSVRALAKRAPRRAAAANLMDYESQYVRIEADPTAPALLVLSDTNYPGWTAYVDGRRTPILIANYMFRGVLLAQGHHTVEFKYQPRSFVSGTIVSGVSFASVVIWLVSRKRRRARHGWRDRAEKV